ncbi:MAG: hypothetical protein HKN93_03350 [Acidimicrobiia bacterium]|nr:hypothetical protein [Acidimicrobiia bacterium]
MRTTLTPLLVAIVLIVAACSDAEPSATSSSVTTSSGPTTTMTDVEASTPSFLQFDGNRLIEGSGGELAPFVTGGRGVQTPEWVMAAANPAGFVVALTAADGETRSFVVAPPEAAPFERLTLAAGGPPLLINEGVVLVPPDDASPLTSPATLSDGSLVWITTDGDLSLDRSAGTTSFEVDALRDSRVLVDDRDRVLILTGPTDSYGHGVLGDGIEASGWAIVDGGSTESVSLAGDDVIEGTSAIWVDIDGDGEREVIVTVSNSAVGAAVKAYSEDGQLRYSGPPIGQGNRWRHQIAFADFGAGRPQLAIVTTPHIGGIVEFYDINGDGTMSADARKSEYTSHGIGSRNLDGGLAGDFDGDGITELVVSTQDRMAMVGLINQGGEILEAWRIDLESRRVANPTAAVAGTGELVLIVVTEDSAIRTFWPESFAVNRDA